MEIEDVNPNIPFGKLEIIKEAEELLSDNDNEDNSDHDFLEPQEI